ncbi:transcription elongation factor S-II-like protein, partial [Leptotrombidium deliense]
MSIEDEVLRIRKKLDKMVDQKDDQSQALDLLKSLKDLKITLDVLQKTRIGMTVNNLRKSSSDEDVISLSKTLIRSWKKLLEMQKQDSRSSTDGNGDNNTRNTSNTSMNSSIRSGDNGNKANHASRPTPQQQKPRQSSFPANHTTNDVRLKCRELISQALKGDAVPEDIDVDCDDLAADIENAIYSEFKDTNMKYKNRVRSRVSNLKDTKNPDLRYNVLKGNIDAKRIAVMTADEMASSEIKALREKLTKEAINDHQMAMTGGTSTALIKCPKCKKSNCTYNQ